MPFRRTIWKISPLPAGRSWIQEAIAAVSH